MTTASAACAQVQTMLAGICSRFRVELAECMGGEAGVLERQISSFTLSVDGGLHMHFHDRTAVCMRACNRLLHRRGGSACKRARRLVVCMHAHHQTMHPSSWPAARLDPPSADCADAFAAFPAYRMRRLRAAARRVRRGAEGQCSTLAPGRREPTSPPCKPASGEPLCAHVHPSVRGKVMGAPAAAAARPSREQTHSFPATLVSACPRWQRVYVLLCGTGMMGPPSIAGARAPERGDEGGRVQVHGRMTCCFGACCQLLQHRGWDAFAALHIRLSEVHCRVICRLGPRMFPCICVALSARYSLNQVCSPQATSSPAVRRVCAP